MKKANEKVFYHIYPLGFCGAPERNIENAEPVERLNKLYGWIDHMKFLGINALYLGPVFESVEHGYDTTDYFTVDRRLGSNDTLRSLVKKLHENGIEVILDGVLNHAGREFFAFRDLKNFGRNSRYSDWFSGVDFSRRSPYNDDFTYDTWAGHYNLVKLNLSNGEVVDHLLNAVKYWISEFDIDGIRLDAADSLDFNFMKRLSETAKGIKPDFWLMGEVVHGDYSRWVNEARIDSTTNYECYKGLYSSHNDKNYFEIAHSLRRQFSGGGVYRDIALYNFADNHDVPRVASTLKNKSHLYPLYTILFTMPGIPSIYYGGEWEAEGGKINGSDRQLRPAVDIESVKNKMKGGMARHISGLSRIRKENKALKYGSYEELFVGSEQFGFARECEGEKIFVLLNSSDREAVVNNSNIPGGKYFDILNGGEVDLAEKAGLRIYPNWARILKRAR